MTQTKAVTKSNGRRSDESRQNPTLSALSANQEKALAAMIGGATVTESAKRAGVHRSTIHDWLKNDIAFRSELNTLRREIKTAMRHRLLGIAQKAIDVLERAIEEGDDPRLALDTLKQMKGLVLPYPPSGCPDLLRHEARQREIASNYDQRYDDNGVLMGPVKVGEEIHY